MAGGLLDPNLSYGWTVQTPVTGSSNTGTTASNLYGMAGPGYAQSANAYVVPAPGYAGQSVIGNTGNAGYPSPSEINSGMPNNPLILTDSGYADSPAGASSSSSWVTTGTMEPQLLTANSTPALPGFPTSGSSHTVTNPSGLAATVTIFTGSGVTVSVVGVANAPSYNVANWTTTQTFAVTGITLAASSEATVTVPPGGAIYVTYAGGTPTWSWVLTN